jgi:subtilisin family serine protease
MDPLEMAGLLPLMALTRGRSDIVIALVDGPVAPNHSGLVTENLRVLGTTPRHAPDSVSEACRHGTFVAGILAAKRGAQAPSIAPDCTLLVRPLFCNTHAGELLPSATPIELAEAIVDSVDAGARVINLSVAISSGSILAQRELNDALSYACRSSALVIAAAGNAANLSGSVITQHPWVIPVVAYDRNGWPLAESTLGLQVGSRGLGAPGEGIASLSPHGETAIASGTSAAAPYVSGAAALLWSAIAGATAADIKHSLISSPAVRPRSVAPPLVNAYRAYQQLCKSPASKVAL